MVMCLINEEGQRAGEINGTIYEEIPDSVYKAEKNLILIPHPQGEYRVILDGTGNGDYSLDIVNLGVGFREAPRSPAGLRIPRFRASATNVRPTVW